MVFVISSQLVQFTQLGSPRECVVEAAIRDLKCAYPFEPTEPVDLTIASDHCQMFRLMGLDKDSVMIIHMGVCPIIWNTSLN